jgi:NitT/TauT family transport system ATP-binding protein
MIGGTSVILRSRGVAEQAAMTVSSADPAAVNSTPTEPGPSLRIRELSLSYKNRQREGPAVRLILDDIGLDARAGEFVTIIGPSGCGKSTLLGCIAGVIDYDSGSICIEGDLIAGPSEHTAVVFQQPSLLAWRTVQANVEYGLQLQGRPRGERRDRARAAIETVGLSSFADYYPHELSGGMQQRVNLARAWALDTRVLLMDEPFGHLDAMTRETMQQELLGLSTASRVTLFVTHDVGEAVLLGDRVIVMSGDPGRIKTVVPVELPRPRPAGIETDARFQSTVAELQATLGKRSEA